MNRRVKPINTSSIAGKENPEKTGVFLDFVKLRINEVTHFPSYFELLNETIELVGLSISAKRAVVPRDYAIGFKVVSCLNPNMLCGQLSYSEKYQRCLFELTGTGCEILSYLDPNYRLLQRLVSQPNIQVRRVDITRDDVSGNYSIEKVDKDYSRGRFNGASGKKPMKENVGTTARGRTRYIGGKTAYKRLCVYEKGKKEYEGIHQYNSWIRYELRLFSNSRDTVPSEVFQYLTEYFYSAYPSAFRKLVGKQPVLQIVDRVAIEFQRKLGNRAGHCRHAYGKTIHKLTQQLTPELIVRLICREGDLKGIDDHELLEPSLLSRHQSVLLQSMVNS